MQAFIVQTPLAFTIYTTMSHKNSNTNLKPQNGQTNAHSTKNLRKTENVEIAKMVENGNLHRKELP